MLEYYRLYLPKSKREIKMEVSTPRQKNNIVFDTVYFLDGQNAFKDSHASFGRSIRAAKTLGITAKEMGKRVLGVAIYNSESDLGRVNEYSPFKIINAASKEWLKQDIDVCKNFCDDFINTIIPFIEKKYNTYKDPSHRAIYGSSLAAITAIYLSYKYENSFKYIGAFSTPTFLFPDDFMSFLEKNYKKDREVFLYVGCEEQSDDIFDKKVYMNSSKSLYDFFKEKKTRLRFVIDSNGHHNEETWGNHIKDFINFIYFDDIIYS